MKKKLNLNFVTKTFSFNGTKSLKQKFNTKNFPNNHKMSITKYFE